MNDQRFTELLNLHLDHETTPAQASEFEAELNRTPARRREYATYRRMHQACTHLFEREQSLAPVSFALEKARLDAQRKAAATAPPVFRRPLVAALGGLAAMAACIVLVLLPRLAPAPSSATTQAGPVKAVVATVQMTAPAAPFTGFANYTPPVASATYRPSPFAAPAPATSAGLTRVDLPEFTPQMELPPLQPVMVDDFAAQSQMTVPQIMAVSRSAITPPPTAQTAAFQFQR
ncbi:MAG: hypothetical protein WCL04_08560 [Verrucomicrobiota bacterium]